MKLKACVLTLTILAFWGCSDREKAVKSGSPQETVSPAKNMNQVALITGESDEFNSPNAIESIRKKKMTFFGRLTTPPKVLTPTQKDVQKALDKPGCFKLTIVSFLSKPFGTPAFPFDYENDIEALKRLHDAHKLNEVAQNTMSPLQMLRALMKYTYTFMEGGTIPSSADDVGPSAEVITRLRKEKGVGGESRHYAALFCQLALSCGFNARIVGMHTLDENGNPLTHDVCEVFLDDYEKWAVFDPYHFATFYTRDTIPQAALEIRDAMLSNNYKVLQPFSEILDFTDVVILREKIIPRYKYIYIWRLNDILGKSPRGGSIPWQALYQCHLVWEDEHTPLADGGFDKIDAFTNTQNPEYPLKGVRYVTHNRDDFYWQLNRVLINLERRAEDDVYLYLDTITPNFKYFELFDQGFKNHSDNVYKLRNYALEFNVRSVNVFGMRGHSSTMQLTPQ